MTHRNAAGALVRLSVLIALCLYCIASARAQTTTITATQQQWGATWLTQGTISLIPVTPDGNPQAFSANGKFYPPASRSNFNSGFTGTIVKGALTTTLIVPDKTSASSAYPLCYDQQIRNDNNGVVFDLGVRCDVTGSTVSLDNYVPSVTAPLYVSGYTHGVAASLPAHCAAGSQYGTDDTHALFMCGLDSIFHAVAGGSSSGAVNSTLFADTTTGTFYQLASTSGRLTLSPTSSGTGAVNSVSITDSNGATRTLSVASGRLTLN